MGGGVDITFSPCRTALPRAVPCLANKGCTLGALSCPDSVGVHSQPGPGPPQAPLLQRPPRTPRWQAGAMGQTQHRHIRPTKGLPRNARRGHRALPLGGPTQPYPHGAMFPCVHWAGRLHAPGPTRGRESRAPVCKNGPQRSRRNFDGPRCKQQHSPRPRLHRWDTNFFSSHPLQ